MCTCLLRSKEGTARIRIKNNLAVADEQLKGHCPDYVHVFGMPPTMPRKPCLWLQAAVLGLDETASTSTSYSDNAARVDPCSLPSGLRSFLGHVNTYRSAVLKSRIQIWIISVG